VQHLLNKNYLPGTFLAVVLARRAVVFGQLAEVFARRAVVFGQLAEVFARFAVVFGQLAGMTMQHAVMAAQYVLNVNQMNIKEIKKWFI